MQSAESKLVLHPNPTTEGNHFITPWSNPCFQKREKKKKKKIPRGKKALRWSLPVPIPFLMTMWWTHGISMTLATIQSHRGFFPPLRHRYSTSVIWGSSSCQLKAVWFPNPGLLPSAGPGSWQWTTQGWSDLSQKAGWWQKVQSLYLAAHLAIHTSPAPSLTPPVHGTAHTGTICQIKSL